MKAARVLRAKQRMVLGLLAALGLVAGVTVLATAPSGADGPNFTQGTADLDTFPSTKPLDPALHKFDGELTSLTITATVDADVEGALTNLSSSPRTLTASVDASIVLDGPQLPSLEAGASTSDSFDIAAGAEVPLVLSDTGEAVTTITDSAVLDLFEGPETETLPYTVTGNVKTTVSGPGNYKSTGVTSGSATVRIDYSTAPPAPAIDLVKTNDANVDATFTDVETAPAEGADVDFKVDITNTGNVPLTITELVDDFGGPQVDLLAVGLCDHLDGATLAVGATVTCTFTLQDYAPAPGSLINTVTVDAEDEEGTPVTANDPSTVNVDEPPPPPCLPEDHVEIKFEEENFDPLTGTPPGTHSISQDGVTITVHLVPDDDDEVDSLTWESTHPIAAVNVKTGDGDFDGSIAPDGLSGSADEIKAISHISFFFCPPETP